MRPVDPTGSDAEPPDPEAMAVYLRAANSLALLRRVRLGLLAIAAAGGATLVVRNLPGVGEAAAAAIPLSAQGAMNVIAGLSGAAFWLTADVRDRTEATLARADVPVQAPAPTEPHQLN